MSISEQLRKAITDSGLTLYRIAKDADVTYSVLYRFVEEERDIRMEGTADKLADYFQMRLTKARRPKGGA